MNIIFRFSNQEIRLYIYTLLFRNEIKMNEGMKQKKYNK